MSPAEVSLNVRNRLRLFFFIETNRLQRLWMLDCNAANIKSLAVHVIFLSIIRLHSFYFLFDSFLAEAAMEAVRIIANGTARNAPPRIDSGFLTDFTSFDVSS